MTYKNIVEYNNACHPKTYWTKTYWAQNILGNILDQNIFVPKHIVPKTYCTQNILGPKHISPKIMILPIFYTATHWSSISEQLCSNEYILSKY